MPALLIRSLLDAAPVPYNINFTVGLPGLANFLIAVILPDLFCRCAIVSSFSKPYTTFCGGLPKFFSTRFYHQLLYSIQICIFVSKDTNQLSV
jgi:hypothetical protein